MTWRPPKDRCKCGNPIRIAGRWCVGCAESEADARLRAYVKKRDGFACVVPGCRSRGRLEWAHIQSRRYRRIRWNPDNAVTLCGGPGGHHAYFTKNPRAWIDFIEETLPGRWAHLLELREHRGGQVNLEAILSTFARAA